VGLSTLNFGGGSKELCKGTLFSFGTNAVFPYDVVLSENDVLEAGWRSCCVCVGNFEFRLSVWTL